MLLKTIIMLLFGLCICVDNMNFFKSKVFRRKRFWKKPVPAATTADISSRIPETSTAAETTETSTATEVEDISWHPTWEDIFKRYDDEKKGSISDKTLQVLIFEQFNGFLTVRQANEYISLITAKKSNRIDVEQFKRLKPIIDVLSTREKIQENEQAPLDSIPKSTFEEEIVAGFYVLFKNRREISEVFKLVGHDPKTDSIKPIQLAHVKNMLMSSLRLQTFYDGFKETDKNHDGFVDAEEMKSLLGGVDKSYDDLKAAEQAIRNHDKNGDGLLDVAEYIAAVSAPLDDDEIFMLEFNTPRITREKLQTLVNNLYGQELKEADLDLVDPNHENSISYQDMDRLCLQMSLPRRRKGKDPVDN
ncbi:uncharacterized protein LOC126836974 isoform X3 [Adelges cooleyi]|uniref:uncharacterized protein LOC126836974 isoform X2 n=1 Tax=Adelges cooleyi TaxID=133065 RepID=UPI0021804235|nr:uncharacterized protein LOC126836974 isoform X2 [Adelges cooleyi]XP_050426653.1 uncharacterized protein LOC126836974 isoform X3 [Adelges cooleyi]